MGLTSPSQTHNQFKKVFFLENPKSPSFLFGRLIFYYKYNESVIIINTYP